MTDTKRKRIVGDIWLTLPMDMIPASIRSSVQIHCADCNADMLLAARDFHVKRCRGKKAAA